MIVFSLKNSQHIEIIYQHSYSHHIYQWWIDSLDRLVKRLMTI